MKVKLLSVLLLSALVSACGGNSSGNATATGGPGAAAVASSSTSGDSGDCFTNVALYTAGNTYQVDLQSLDGKGAVTLVSANRYTVNGSTTFKGNPATELQVDTSVVSGIGVGSRTRVKNDTRLDAREALTFGQTSVVTALGGSASTTTAFEPALRKPFVYGLNTPYSHTYTLKIEGPQSSADKPVTLKETFLGTETISVPAGSFKACKMSSETTQDGSTTKTINWTVAEGPYRGLFLQSADGNGSITARATLLRFNGA